MQPSIYDSLSQDTAACADSLLVMMQKEKSEAYTSNDYLRQTLPAHAGMTITESDRLKIVDWCYTVIDQCQFDRETVAIAMEMVDRFLSKPHDDIARLALQDRNQFQLLAMAALYTAIKTNEKLALGSEFFSAMSRGVYSVGDIEAMEFSLLKGLSWRIFKPTSIQVAHHILSLVFPLVDIQETTWGFILDEVRYQTEHAVRDYCLTTQRPSTLAMASILLTIDQVNKQDRQAILHALLLVMNDDFASLEHLVAAKNRLICLVARVPVVVDEDEVTVLTAQSREVEDSSCSQQKRGLDETFDERKGTKIPRTSPHTVSPST